MRGERRIGEDGVGGADGENFIQFEAEELRIRVGIALFAVGREFVDGGLWDLCIDGAVAGDAAAGDDLMLVDGLRIGGQGGGTFDGDALSVRETDDQIGGLAVDGREEGGDFRFAEEGGQIEFALEERADAGSLL